MIDINNCFTHDGSGGLVQAITTDAISTNVIDLTMDSTKTTIQMGVGKSAPVLKVQVTVAAGGMASGIIVTLESDSAAGLSGTNKKHLTTSTLLAADLTAGSFIFNQRLPSDTYYRYLGLRFNLVSEAATGLTVCGWLGEESDSGVTGMDND